MRAGVEAWQGVALVGTQQFKIRFIRTSGVLLPPPTHDTIGPQCIAYILPRRQEEMLVRQSPYVLTMPYIPHQYAISFKKINQFKEGYEVCR